MSDYPFGSTVDLVTRTVNGADSLGNDTFTETTTTLTGVPVWPQTSTENVQGRDEVISTYEALLPAGTNVQAIDRLVWQGDSYEVTGLPAVYTHPLTGLTPGLVVTLKRASG